MESFSSDQIFIGKLTDIILSNIENGDFSTDDLVLESGISRFRLRRRISAVLNKTINQFIREVRLRRAREILENSDLTAAEVAYRTGFGSPTYFNKCFHEFYGYPPGKVKNRTNIGHDENENDPVIEVVKNKTSVRKTLFKVLPLIIIVTVIILLFVNPEFNFNFRNIRNAEDQRGDDRISVFVLPFQNMTDDRVLDTKQGGIQDIFINNLSASSDELVLIQPELAKSPFQITNQSNYASITPSAAKRISRKLKPDFFIYGTIQQADTVLQLNAQITRPGTGKVVRSFEHKGNPYKPSIFGLADSLSKIVRNYLVISKMEKGIHPELKTYQYYNSPEAFKYFLLGCDALIKRKDNSTTMTLFRHAIELDSNYVYAKIFLSIRYSELGMYKEAREWGLSAYKDRDLLPVKERVLADLRYAELNGTVYDRIRSYKQFLEDIDDEVPYFNLALGRQYNILGEYDKSISEFKKALKIYKKWNVKPKFIENYTFLMFAYHKTDRFNKEKRLFKKAETDFPDDLSPLYRQQAIFEFNRGHTARGTMFAEKYRSALKTLSYSEPDILTSLASMYCDAGIFNVAEENYRKAINYKPGNPSLLNKLGYFLIDNELGIDEGIMLADSALKSEPENFNYLHTLGWGLYKKNKFSEALEILQKSWDLRMNNSIYNHTAFIHLEESQKAVAENPVRFSRQD
jgi:AraC-like DNA-binding protein/tetratricopeptide (TPR) repeat protein/TolB-like protein